MLDLYNLSAVYYSIKQRGNKMKFDINNIHEETKEGYIPGVHCGDKHCYACGTQRYSCAWLDELDKIEHNKK